MSQVLQVRDLEKVYGSSKENITRAVSGVSFDIAEGEFVAIMGPSGSGKTTLINCITTIDKPTSGSVVIGGTLLDSMNQRQLSDFRSHELGFIFQDSNLLDTLTCFENIALPLTITGVHSSEIQNRVNTIAGILGISDILSKFPYQVSGGQKQRVAACRALITHPKLIVADEPTGSLDSKNSEILLESFEKMNTQANATILMVTHDAFAASWCHRVLFLRDGQLFSELQRGSVSRKSFFDEIMNMLTIIGGGEDVR